ncbi:hypothetical protein JL722_1036 [Aureococcus anophagefferens]|nr:hypothetical protein JL722_1036 [Aureococcus anophagefferens]
MAKGKGKKGKGKGKGPVGPEVVTTRTIIRERERCMCPRLGDAAVRSERADAIRLELRTVPELRKLTELDLSRNQLFGSDHVFSMIEELNVLRKLNLSDNFFNGPLSERCTKMVALEDLALDGNQLTELPENVGDWKLMKRFSAAKNELKALPESSAWTGSRTSTSGTTSSIAVLPDEVSFLTKLRELDVRTNHLSHVPPALSACRELKLHLGNNRIADVPAEVLAHLTEVEELHLYKNKLDALPEQIGSLTKRTRLTLSSNNLRTLPDAIASCQSLSELYINNCGKFANLPSSSGDLVNLQELQAKKCPGLKSLPNTAVAWANLRELDLRAAKKQVCKLRRLIATLGAQRKKSAAASRRRGKKGRKSRAAPA